MLEVAKKRAVAKHKLKFIQGDAQKIPLPDHSVEHVTVAYGIRNVKDPSLCFKEVHRVLKPNGTFNILELTEPDNKIIRTGHRLYLTKILPFMGGLITANPSAYSYLSSSIQNFVKPCHLKKLLEESGFKNVTLEPLNFGVAHILRAAK
jgi:demethylmenaquinone methyltransferase/2-methoxy-6-polyprenyl-1,4-benzoquinol methylase